MIFIFLSFSLLNHPQTQVTTKQKGRIQQPIIMVLSQFYQFEMQQYYIRLYYKLLLTMGNKNSTEIQIKMDQASYFPGQTITATIFINAPVQHFCNKIVLHIQGYEESQFRSDYGNRDLMNSQNTLIRTFCVLKKFKKSKAYLLGQYEYPCTFTLPWVLPGSFKEEKSQYKAKIVYQMKCILVSPKGTKENFEKIQEIVIRERQKQVDDYQMGNVVIKPKCLCFKNLGVSETKCWLQKKNYLPNDDCNMICELDNTRSKRDIKRVKCEFKRIITLRATNGISKTIKETLNTVEFQGARKGQGYIGPLAKKVNLPLRYKSTLTGIHPSTTGCLIRCEYSIEVTPEVGGCFTEGDKTFVVNLQIMPPQLIQNLPNLSNWKPEVGLLSKISLANKDDSEMRKSLNADHDINEFAAQ